jgi:hypothetical protein
MQFVTAEDRDNVGLTVIVLKTADKKAKIMRILAPLGVLLPSGLGLKIDDTGMGRAGFVRCLPNGCVAEVILEDKLLKSLGTARPRPSSSSRHRRKGSGSRSRSPASSRASTACPDRLRQREAGLGPKRLGRRLSARHRRFGGIVSLVHYDRTHHESVVA